MDLESVISLALFSFGLMVIIAGLASLLIRGIVVVLAGAKRKAAPPTPVAITVAPAIDETAAHVAAIAAAVYAVVGAQRLVHIGEAARDAGWTATGRLSHHASHTPRRTPR